MLGTHGWALLGVRTYCSLHPVPDAKLQEGWKVAAGMVSWLMQRTGEMKQGGWKQGV